MESESLLRRVATPVQLPTTHKETKESQTEQHCGRSHVRPTDDQLVLSELSMIAIDPQIENAHTVTVPPFKTRTAWSLRKRNDFRRSIRTSINLSC